MQPPESPAPLPPIEVTCGAGHTFRVKAKYAGRRGRCPTCQAPIAVPASGLPSSPASEPPEALATQPPQAFEMTTLDFSPAHTPANPLAAVANDFAAPGEAKMLGRFRLLRKLGSGAFGTVFQAHDPQLDRAVALKVPSSEIFDDSRQAQRFLREARACAQLRHPNIVPIYDAGHDGRYYYLASAYIEGETLKDAMQHGRFATHRDVAELVRKIANALAYAHEQGIVHRDIKPANIMVDSDGSPHIMDFGLARRDEGDELKTQEGARMGTPAYMSPEQAAGESHTADGRSDQWSIGVMLYEMLTGARPFCGSIAEILDAVRSHDPPRPRSIDRTIPLDLETICLKCLAKNPAERYASCQLLADDLDRCLNDMPIAARRIGLTERAWRWGRRNPVLSTLALSVAAVTLIGLAGVSWQWNRAERALAASNDANKQVAASVTKLQAEVNARRKVENSLRERELEVADKEKQLAAKASELTKLASALNIKDQSLTEKNKLLQARDRTLQERAMEVARLSGDLENAQDLAELRESEAVAASQSRDAILGSATWVAYRHHFDKAQQLLAKGEKRAAEEELNKCPLEHRSWEWDFLDSRFGISEGRYRWREFPFTPTWSKVTGGHLVVATRDPKPGLVLIDPASGEVKLDLREFCARGRISPGDAIVSPTQKQMVIFCQGAAAPDSLVPKTSSSDLLFVAIDQAANGSSRLDAKRIRLDDSVDIGVLDDVGRTLTVVSYYGSARKIDLTTRQVVDGVDASWDSTKAKFRGHGECADQSWNATEVIPISLKATPFGPFSFALRSDDPHFIQLISSKDQRRIVRYSEADLDKFDARCSVTLAKYAPEYAIGPGSWSVNREGNLFVGLGVGREPIARLYRIDGEKASEWPLLESFNDVIAIVGFTPDSKRLVLRQKDALRVWDLEKATEAAMIPFVVGSESKANQREVSPLVVTDPDWSIISWTNGEDRTQVMSRAKQLDPAN